MFSAKRKITLTISAILIAADIGVSAVIYNAGEQRVSAVLSGVSTIVAVIREYTRPYPTL